MENINLVQRFQGTKPYILNYNGELIDVSHAVVKFNFTDRTQRERYSITCRSGSSLGEVLIPFTQAESSISGEFYGEFVVKTARGVDIYPIESRIIVRIRKGV